MYGRSNATQRNDYLTVERNELIIKPEHHVICFGINAALGDEAAGQHFKQIAGNRRRSSAEPAWRIAVRPAVITSGAAAKMKAARGQKRDNQCLSGVW